MPITGAVRGNARRSAKASGLRRGWIGWYRFARTALGYRHDEAVVYANVRHVEEENRAVLRSEGSAGT
jgi:hypothetical protein